MGMSPAKRCAHERTESLMIRSTTPAPVSGSVRTSGTHRGEKPEVDVAAVNPREPGRR